MNEIIVLKICDGDCVDFDGLKLRSTNEVADALDKVRAANPAAIISIETDDSEHYDAIGKAIYGCHRAGFSGEQLRILVGGKLQ